MTKKTGTILIVLSLPVLVIGALNVKMIMLGLDPSRVPMALGITGGGVLLLALGAFGIKRVAGAVVLLAGSAALAGIYFRQKSNGEKWEAEFARDRAVKDAAEGVCAGKPNTAAAGTVRAAFKVIHSTESEKWFATDDSALPAPETPEQLHVVACIKRPDVSAGGCSYDGGYHISFYQRVDEYTVYDAKTLKVLGAQRFEGKPPSSECDSSIKVSSRDSLSHDSYGASPDEAAELAFVKSFLSSAERAP